MPKVTSILLLLLFAITGCDSSKKQIIGKWKAEGESNQVVWEFFENGTLTTDGAPGRYTFGDGKRVKIQTPSATFVHQIEFEGERMIWKDPRGSKIEFTRVK